MPKRRRDDVPSLANLAKRVVYDWGAVDTIRQLVGMSQMVLTEVVRWAQGFHLPVRRLTNPMPQLMRTVPNPWAPARWDAVISWRHRWAQTWKFRSVSAEPGTWSGTDRMKWRAALPTRLDEKRAWNFIRARDQPYLTETLAAERARLAVDPLGGKIWGPYVNPLVNSGGYVNDFTFIGDPAWGKRGVRAVMYDALMASLRGWPTNWPAL